MVNVVVAVLLPWVAVSVTVVAVATGLVVTVKFAVVAPAKTVTLVGTVAEVELVLNVTGTPPVGAAELRVTVPVEDTPPRTDVGETDTVDRATGLIVRVAVTEAPPDVAVMTGEEPEVDATVLTVKVAVVAPERTVTDAGTVAVALLDESVTTVPAEGAALVRVTVPVDVLPAMTEVGERVTDEG